MPSNVFGTDIAVTLNKYIMIRELKSSSIVSVIPIYEQNEKIADNLNEFGTIIVIR